jgi:hypothetical protein
MGLWVKGESWGFCVEGARASRKGEGLFIFVQSTNYFILTTVRFVQNVNDRFFPLIVHRFNDAKVVCLFSSFRLIAKDCKRLSVRCWQQADNKIFSFRTPSALTSVMATQRCISSQSQSQFTCCLVLRTALYIEAYLCNYIYKYI